MIEKDDVMSDGFVYIEALSGAAGSLSAMQAVCDKINQRITDVLLATGVSRDELNSIDADCNTCRYLKRVPFDRAERKPHIWGMPGVCKRDGRHVVAWGMNQYVGASCWMSRTSDRTSANAPGNPFDGEQYALRADYDEETLQEIANAGAVIRP